MTKQRTTNYPLRMPDELREKIESAAKESGRSLHSEILYRLELYEGMQAWSKGWEDKAKHLHEQRDELRNLLREAQDRLIEKERDEELLKDQLAEYRGILKSETIQQLQQQIQKEIEDTMAQKIRDQVRQAIKEYRPTDES
jgi:membrane-associated HD superfamily phosphohydrolase